MKNLSSILILTAWSIMMFSIGQLRGVSIKTTSVVSQVEETVMESIRTGQPFVFHNGRIGLIIEQKRSKYNNRLIAYRAIAFIWPEDVEVRPTPINKFGQYTWHSRELRSSAPGTNGKERERP